MCGIGGVVGRSVPRETLEEMGAAMFHRGPDDFGCQQGDGYGFTFRRLSIIDLAGGHQPMTNEDGKVVVVFNGEIYDHSQLRDELQGRGHQFATTNSDTEVLVHGWEEWGHDLFPKLNGMFGVAIWDSKRRSLVLARDRYGVKPVYYAERPDGSLVFASEIRTILASGLVPSEPAPEGVMEYIEFQNVWRDQTMFRGVKQLAPGTTLEWRDGNIQLRQYWDITFARSRRDSHASLVEEHRDILERAIARQSVADVPIRSYLSGGIDSTAIAVAAHRRDPSVTAYSCIFDLDNVGADAHADEREFSRLVAETYGMDRVELELPQDSMAGCLPEYVASLEDLRMGMGYPVYKIAERVARDAKVVLSGTGGDEFHAGYVGRYLVLGLDERMQGVRKPWSQRMRAGLRGMLNRVRGRATIAGVPAPRTPEEIYRAVLNVGPKPAEFATTFTPEFTRSVGGYDPDAVMSEYLERCPSDDWRDRVMYVDAKTYLAGLLVLEDKLSMAHGLEARVPLLDNELIDFVLDVPFEHLWQGEKGKVLFRDSVKPWVPEAIYNKPKMGFGPPDASWYRGILRPYIERTLLEEVDEVGRGIYLPEYVRRMIDEHMTGTADRTYQIWTLLNFEQWCRAFGFYGASKSVTSRAA